MHGLQSRKTAFCGVLGAMSVTLLLVGNLLQIGTYAAPMVACFLLIPVQEEFGNRQALMLYLTVALLSLIGVPDKELTLFYDMVLGYYPVLKAVLDRLHSRVLRWGIKFLFFNLAVLVMYLLLLAVFAGPALRDEFATAGAAMLLLTLAVGNVSFVLCDFALDAVRLAYRLRLRPKLKRWLP